MTSLDIKIGSIPSLQGQVAIITDGSSGIGLAAVELLAERGAPVFILDKQAPPDNHIENRSLVNFIECDVTSWSQLVSAFESIGSIDMLYVNPGVSEDEDFLNDVYDDAGNLLEPAYRLIDVNFRAVLNAVKLACRAMTGGERSGSIVITSSATAYAPEHSLPVYSAIKTGPVGLIRALRTTLPFKNITINGVAPSATSPGQLPSTVALAMVYSATATGVPPVEVYGKGEDSEIETLGRWNGGGILTLGDTFTEIEGPLANFRPLWLGESNWKLIREQQAATDSRV